MLLTAHMLGDQIGPFAQLIHALVLTVLAIAWIFPPMSTYLREREHAKGTNRNASATKRVSKVCLQLHQL